MSCIYTRKILTFTNLRFKFCDFFASLVTMSVVSENIRYLRKLKGYTQQQFAERIGIKRSLLGAYEEARANPNEIYLDSMAEVLGVPVEHLLHKDLREMGRRLGAGTILRLNPERVNTDQNNSSSESAIPSTDKKQKDTAQTDLFSENEVNPASQVNKPQELKSAASPEDDTFLDWFSSVISERKDLRLFSSIDDVPVAGLKMVGERLSDLESIRNNELYLLETSDGKLLYRRVFNQLAIKGTLILSSDYPNKPTIELTRKEIKTAYHYLASLQTTAPSISVPLHRIKELNDEIARILSGSN